MKNLQSTAMEGSAAARPDVTIVLDGKPQRVPAGSTLADLVDRLGHAPEAVSTAVNGDFVPRSARSRLLADGDAVLLFQPIVGG